MQYAITLPADYDMRIIRRRVAERAGALDDFAGLGIKAYLVRERGADGSPVNQYAPFYLWNETSGMNRFLWDGGYDNVVASFGRAPVRQWAGLAFARGASFGRPGAARAATLHARTLGPDEHPAAAARDAAAALGALAEAPGVHAAAAAIDPHAWELVRFTLWDQAPAPGAAGARFAVLRTNTPGARALPTGRHW